MSFNAKTVVTLFSNSLIDRDTNSKTNSVIYIPEYKFIDLLNKYLIFEVFLV